MRTDDQPSVETSEATTVPKKPTPKKAKKPPVETVSLADICKELKIAPKKARAKLRASKLKHAHGASWEWPKGSVQIKEVKALLRD